MTVELWTIVAVGIGLAGLILKLNNGLERRMGNVETRLGSLELNYSHLLGWLQGSNYGIPR